MLTTDLQGSAWRGTSRKGQWARLTGGLSHTRSFPGGSEVKASACNVGDRGSIPGLGRFPWRRKWQPTPVLLSGESHGWRSLVGYSPRDHKESDTTEQLHFHFSLKSYPGVKLIPSRVALTYFGHCSILCRIFPNRHLYV